MPVAGKRPPKKWAKKFIRERMREGYSRESAGAIMGKAWYHNTPRSKRHAIRKREYGRRT